MTAARPLRASLRPFVSRICGNIRDGFVEDVERGIQIRSTCPLFHGLQSPPMPETFGNERDEQLIDGDVVLGGSNLGLFHDVIGKAKRETGHLRLLD